jgi:moderate conductance mechanosensitive channel
MLAIIPFDRNAGIVVAHGMSQRWFPPVLLVIALTLPAAGGLAQTSQGPSPRPEPALTPEQARAALDTLNDPKKRAAFEATLLAIAHGAAPASQPPAARTQPEPGQPAPGQPESGQPEPGQPGAGHNTTTETAASPPAEPSVAPGSPQPAAPAPATTSPSPTGIPIQLEPNSLGAQILLSASSFLTKIANEVPQALETVHSLPLLWAWIVIMATHPLGRELLANTAWRLSAVLAMAVGAELLLYLLLRRPMARVLALGHESMLSPEEVEEDPEARAERGATEPPAHRRITLGLGRRIGLGLARFGLQLVPIAGLLIVGHVFAASNLAGYQGTRLIILAVLDATAACQIMLAILTLLFEPDPQGLRLLSMHPIAGAYMLRWGRRLILIAVPGYTIGEVALLLGLSAPAHAALQKAVGLALVVCFDIIVVQRRRQVRRWLSAPDGSTGVLTELRNGLAKRWYWVALFFFTGSWIDWTLREPNESGHVLWYFGSTVTVVVAAMLLRIAVLAVLEPLQPASGAEQAATAEGTFRSRLGVYRPALKQLAELLITVGGMLTLLQLFGVGALTWLADSQVGNRLLSGFGTLAVTIGLAFLTWEAVNAAIQMRMETLRREAQAARSARLRTLLPLIRTSLAITVAVVAGLMVLSEIGVNIAPLLAGAGIVGVAIGFGSQKLVQDVITGVFLLLENTMQVGDVVKVGDQSGAVESLSVRTIRLRTEDGSVVVIPFSSVTTVINMTRDYSRAVISVPIAIGEDVDRVVDVMRDIIREMRAEEAWSEIILDDLEMFGVDQFTNSAMAIRCRVMCTPFGRWSVGREFNRRLQARFETVGITAAASALKLIDEAASPAAATGPDGHADDRDQATKHTADETIQAAQ